ncbi:MAG: glycosyltransferase [Solirubrobacteraceae bacterium]
MRVLTVGNMYPPHHLGGYELVWRSLTGHLRAGGHEVTVLTTDHRRDGVTEDEPAWVHRDLRWWWRDHAFPRFGPRARLRRERHNAAVLAERIEAHRPDVVVWTAMGGMSLSLIEQVRRRGLPAVGLVHDDWLLYGPRVDAWLRMWGGPRGTVGERWTGIPVRVDFAGAARWLFVSEFLRRKALEGAALDGARTAVVHSGIDDTLLGALAPPRPWAGKLLSVGRIDARKGLDTAIRALALLPDARLRVVGEGDDRTLKALRELAAELGVAGRVTFAGFQEGAELAATYAAADAVLFPVIWDEPWGLVPLEAMAQGAPVIATGRGGSAEYLADGDNALLHAAGDHQGLAAAVGRLAADAALRERLRQAGARTAAAHTASAANARFEEAIAAEAAGA